MLPLRGMETGCNRADVEAWSPGALEMRCRRCLFASRALELKRIVVVEISSFRSSRLCAQTACGQVAIGGHGIPSTANTSCN